MRKVWLALIAAACFTFSAIGLAACGGGKDKHVFSEEWESNANQHWHVCTAHEDCGEISGTGIHVWGTGENSNKCTVCNYERHVHEFEWEFNESTHEQVATCHPDIKQNEGAHKFENGTCACGVTQAEVEAYPAYKAYIEALGDEPTPFADWVEMIASSEGTLSTNAAGDVTYTHGEDGAESEVWYAQRTVTASATRGGAPLQGVWFKVTATQGEEAPELLGVAITGADGAASITFYPLGYTSEELTYAVEIAAEDETGYGLPYPADARPLSADAMAVEVTAETATIAAGTATFEKVLAPGTSLENVIICGNTDVGGHMNADWIPLGNVPEGFYEFEIYGMEGNVFNSGSNLEIYVQDEGTTRYVPYTINAGTDSKSEGNFKALLYIPAGSTRIGIRDGIIYSARRGNVSLSVATSSIGTSYLNGTPVVVGTGHEYSCSLPAGAYSFSGTVYSGVSTSSNISVRVGSKTYSAADGVFIINDPEEKITFSYSNYHYYAEVSFGAVNAVTLNEEFSVEFTEDVTEHRVFVAPSEGAYKITAYADEAFTGTAVKISGKTILSADESATSHTGSFHAGENEAIAFAFSGSGTVKFKIEKLDAGENVLQPGEETEIALAAHEAKIYSFTPSAAGVHTFAISGNGSLAGLTVLAKGGETIITCSGETNYTFFTLEADATELTFLNTNGAALTFKVLVATDTADTLSNTGSELTLSFAATHEAQYMSITVPAQKTYTLLFTGDVGSIKLYNLATKSLVSLSGGKWTGSLSGTTTYAVIYEGESAGSVAVKAMIQLGAVTVSGASSANRIYDPSIKWNPVADATSYEIWLKDGEAAIATVGADTAESGVFTWSIPKTYWTQGTHTYIVKAKAENCWEGVSADYVLTYTVAMGLIHVTVTAPETYPAGIFSVVLHAGTANKDHTFDVKADGTSATSAKIDFFLEANDTYTVKLGGSHPLDPVYKAETEEVTVGAFEDSEVSVTFAVVKDKDCDITVTVNLPEDNATQQGDLNISMLTIELWKDGEKYTPAKGNGLITGIGGATSGEAIFTVTEPGEYTVKITGLYEAFKYTEQTITVEASEDHSEQSVTLTIEKKNANTVTIALPAEFEGGDVTIEIWQGESKKAEKTATIAASAETAPVIFYGIEDGTYTVKMTLSEALQAHYLASADGTLTITEGASEAVTLTVKDKTKSTVTITGATGSTRIKIALMKEDREVYTAESVSLSSGSGSYIFYGVEAGEYTIVLTFPDQASRPYHYSYEKGTLNATAEAGGNAEIAVTVNATTSVGVTIADPSLVFGSIIFNIAKADEAEKLLDTVSVSLTANRATATISFYLPAEASGEYIVTAAATEGSGNNKYLFSFKEVNKTITVAENATSDTVALEIADEHWTVLFTVSDNSLDGKSIGFELGHGSMFNSSISSGVTVAIANAQAKLVFFNFSATDSYSGKYRLRPRINQTVVNGYTMNGSAYPQAGSGDGGITLDSTTKEYTYKITAPDPDAGTKVNVWTSFGGFSEGYYGTLTFVWVDTTQNDKVVGKEQEYTVSANSRSEFSWSCEFPSSYATTSNCSKLKLKLKSAKGVGGVFDFTDKVQVGESSGNLTGYSQAISRRYDMTWQTWLYFKLNTES